MKRRKLSHCWNALHAVCSLFLCSILLMHTALVDTAIMPPPWSDPAKNPCASMPGGWQLLYWPQLKKCFKIFTLGYPCPDTMELSPTATVSGGYSGGNNKKNSRNAPVAECRCPPSTALSADTNKCHKIFERGPCELGAYFSPLVDNTINGRRMASNHQYSPNHRWGECRKPRNCPDSMLYWPKDNKCYTKYTKGPCGKGKLLVLNDEGLAECKCEDTGVLGGYFYAPEETCHEHYTKGPCSTPGQLFLPGGRCDCHENLPHFHDDFKMCFELNTVGPCPAGHIYSVPDNGTRAQCQCKEGYIPWNNGRCYRLYTRGPCAANEFLMNSTSCVTNFCGKSRLYFPDQKSCYRIGSQGPCDLHQVVVFDFTARPSIDGISYNGMCGCSGVIANLDQQCNPNDMGGIGIGIGIDSSINQGVGTAAITMQVNACESTPGMVELNGVCHKLYTRGPCGPGQWLEPLKTHVDSSKNVNLPQLYHSSKAKCVCRPGYTIADDDEPEENESASSGEKSMKQRCNAPSVGLARYLNVHQRQRMNSKFSTTSFTFNETSSASTIYRFEFLN